MKSTILISKKQAAMLLGGISESMVLRLIRNQQLPCKRLTRHTILFEANAVKRWAETRPVLRKTLKQQAETARRKLEAKRRKQQRIEAEMREYFQQRPTLYEADGQQQGETAQAV